MNMNIPGIDMEKAIKNIGSESLFLELLGDVYKLMDEKCAQVEAYVASHDLSNYTILVHSLKTTCRMIGATDLGEQFYALETLGKENNWEQICALTPDVLSSFQSLKPYLEPFASTDHLSQNTFDKDAIAAILQQLIAALEEFDLGAAESAIQSLLSYHYNEELSNQIAHLDQLVTNLDYEDAQALSLQILDML